MPRHRVFFLAITSVIPDRAQREVIGNLFSSGLNVKMDSRLRGNDDQTEPIPENKKGNLAVSLFVRSRRRRAYRALNFAGALRVVRIGVAALVLQRRAPRGYGLFVTVGKVSINAAHCTNRNGDNAGHRFHSRF
jgi:hypothetical protein